MAAKSPYVTHVWVDGFVKKYKTWVYAIEATWSDARKFEIYRRYADFFSLQNTLLQLFPIEAGKINPNDRVIPSLPTIDNVLKLFGRTNSEAVMQARLKTINYYCQVVLMKLDLKISRSKFVLGFFRPAPGDKQLKMLSRPASLHPQKIPAGSLFEECLLLADYTAEEGHEEKQLSVKAGETVLVLNRDTTGWCLVNRVADKRVGWVPEGFLKKPEDNLSDCLDDTATDDEQSLEDETQSGTSDTGETETSSMFYHAIAEYTTEDVSQIGFPEGAKVLVIDQDEDGWWFASYDGREGWVPASFLEPNDASMAVQLDMMDAVQLPEKSTTGDAIGDEDTKAQEIVKHSEQEDGDSEPTVYYTKVDYTAHLEDEISFPKGVAVKLLSKSALGWWTVRYNDQVGLAPATFLSETPLDSDREHSSLRKRASRMGRPPPRRKSVQLTLLKKKLSGLAPSSKDGPDGSDVSQKASSPFSRQRKRSPRNSPVSKRHSREVLPVTIEESSPTDAQNSKKKLSGLAPSSKDGPDGSDVSQKASSPFSRQRKRLSPRKSPVSKRHSREVLPVAIEESSPTDAQNSTLIKSLDLSGEFKLRLHSAIQPESENGRHSPSSCLNGKDDYSDLPADSNDGGSSPTASPHAYRRRAEDLERKNGDVSRRRAQEKARSRSPSPRPGSKPLIERMVSLS